MLGCIKLCFNRDSYLKLERSGMLVEAPRKEGKEKSNIVDDILKKAAEYVGFSMRFEEM
jgi:hypothetical protein